MQRCNGLVTLRRGGHSMHQGTTFPMQPISLCAHGQGRPSGCLAACHVLIHQTPAAHQTALRGRHVATHGSSILKKGRHAAGLAHALPTVLKVASAWQGDSSGAWHQGSIRQRPDAACIAPTLLSQGRQRCKFDKLSEWEGSCSSGGIRHNMQRRAVEASRDNVPHAAQLTSGWGRARPRENPGAAQRLSGSLPWRQHSQTCSTPDSSALGACGDSWLVDTREGMSCSKSRTCSAHHAESGTCLAGWQQWAWHQGSIRQRPDAA